MKCLEIARLKDFAPNTPGLLGVDQGPQTPCREVRDSRYVSTNPPLEIPAYGPESILHFAYLFVEKFFDTIYRVTTKLRDIPSADSLGRHWCEANHTAVVYVT